METTANGTVETQVVIQYDVFGNRLEEQVWTPSAGWTTTRFAYDAWDPATPSGVGNENWKVWATLDGDNNLVTRYINGDALDQVFAQISAGGTVAWYLTDRLGSTRALVDNDGNVVDVITYDAWGNITSQTNPSAQPLFMFTGIAFDATLGLYCNGNGVREYDPETGRFIEQDPKQFATGDSNLYRYVGNDPTNAVDPSGLQEDLARAQMAMGGFWVTLDFLLSRWMTNPKPTMPPGTPEFGRNQVKWGTGAQDAIDRAKNITPQEARQLDPDKVRQTRDWYRQVYKNNPSNLAAKERANLMQRILNLQQKSRLIRIW